jgi:hypothetical protein
MSSKLISKKNSPKKSPVMYKDIEEPQNLLNIKITN